MEPTKRADRTPSKGIGDKIQSRLSSDWIFLLHTLQTRKKANL